MHRPTSGTEWVPGPPVQEKVKPAPLYAPGAQARNEYPTPPVQEIVRQEKNLQKYAPRFVRKRYLRRWGIARSCGNFPFFPLVLFDNFPWGGFIPVDPSAAARCSLGSCVQVAAVSCRRDPTITCGCVSSRVEALFARLDSYTCI